MSSTGDRRKPPSASSVVAAERARRLTKLDRLRERGLPPYPVRFDRDRTVADARAQFDALAAGEETDVTVRIAGRLMLLRRHGGLVFADLHDQTGDLQLFAARDDLGPEALADVDALDRGDWVGV